MSSWDEFIKNYDSRNGNTRNINNSNNTYRNITSTNQSSDRWKTFITDYDNSAKRKKEEEEAIKQRAEAEKKQRLQEQMQKLKQERQLQQQAQTNNRATAEKILNTNQYPSANQNVGEQVSANRFKTQEQIKKEGEERKKQIEEYAKKQGIDLNNNKSIAISENEHQENIEKEKQEKKNQATLDLVNNNEELKGKSTEEKIKYIKEHDKEFSQKYRERMKEIDEEYRPKDAWEKFTSDTGHSIGNLGLGIGKGAQNVLSFVNNEFKEIKDIATAPVVEVENFIGQGNAVSDYLDTDIEDALQKNRKDLAKGKNDIQELIEENINSQYSETGKRIAGVTPSIGEQIPAMAVRALNPVAGTATSFAIAEEDYYDDAVQRGMNEIDARTYANIMGVVEAKTEGITFGNAKKLGAKIAGKTITKETGQEIARATLKSTLKDFGFNIAENAIQEAVTEPIQEVVAGAVGGQDKANWDNISGRMLDSGLNGAISATITNGASAGVGSAVAVTNKIKNGQQVTTQELKTAIEDTKKAGIDVDKIAEEAIISESQKIQKEEQNKQVEQIQNDIQDIDNKIEQQSAYNTKKEDFRGQEIYEQALNEMYNERAQKESELKSFLVQEQEKQNMYQYKSSENEKIDTLRKSASKYLDNSIKTQNLIDTIEKVIEDKDYSVIFDNTITSKNGQKVNAQVKTLDNGETEIRINHESNRAAEILLTHEITHSIETDAMKKLVMEYANKNEDFAGTLQELKEQYGADDVSDEVLADVSGQLFGNQEFINDLSMQKPSIFKRIYNTIISLANKLTGNKIKSLFIQDLKNKWQKAYSSNNKELDNTKYKIETDEKNRNYVKADRQVIFGDDYLEWERQVEDYINEKIRNGQDVNVLTDDGDILTITEDTAGKAKFRNEIIDKNGNMRRLNKKEFLSKLTAEAHIDELAQISKQSNKTIVPDYKNHSFAKDGFNYRIAYFEDFDGQYYQITMSVGKNGDINTIYNIGKMNKKNRSTSSLVAQRPSNNNVTSNEENTSKSNIQQEKEKVNIRITGDKQKRLEYLRSIDTSQMGLLVRGAIKTEIRALENGFDTIEEYREAERIKQKKAKEESEKERQERANKREQQEKEKQEKLNKEISEATSFKKAQFNIVQESNPMQDDYHVGIRSPADIKSAEEAFFDDGESFAWGDFSYEDAQKALKDGKVTIYSSYPINQGVFVSTSKIQAEEYAGGNKVYSKIVPLDEVAWINGDEGQYAKVNNDTRYSQNSDVPLWQQWLEENFQSRGTRTKFEDILQKNKTDIQEALQNKISSIVEPIQETIQKMSEQIDSLSKEQAPLMSKQIETEQMRKGYQEKSNKDNSTMSDEEIDYVVMQERATYNEKIDNTLNIINDANEQAKYSLNMDKEAEAYSPVSSNPKIQGKLENQGDTISNTIDKISNKRSKEKTSFKKIKDDFAQAIVNKGHYVDKIAKDMKNANLKYAYDRMLGSFGEAQYCIGREQVNSKGEKTGKGIMNIFKPAQKAKLYNEFNDYLFNRHNIDRLAVDKAVFGKEFTAENSKRIIRAYEAKYPEFKQWSRDVYRFNKNNLQELLDEGFIDKATYDNISTMYGHYVPTFRDIIDGLTKEDNSVTFDFTGDDKAKEKKVGFSPMKKATGGNQNLLAVDEAMAEQIIMQKRAIRMNQTIKELYKSIQKSGKTEAVQIPMPKGDITIATLLTSSPENFIQETESGNYIAMFYDNGEIKSFKIEEDVYKAFAPSSIEELINKNAFSKATAGFLKKVTDFRRNLLTTYSIGFSMNNPIKDIEEAVFNTKYGVGRFGLNYARALFEMAIGGKYYKDYLRQGGGANTYFEYDTGIKKSNKVVKAMTTPIRIVNQLNEVLERAPRLAEYISTIQQTGNVNEALYNSAEITTNFKRGGDVTKAFNRYGVNFFNASVQGMDKLWRNIKGENGAKGYVQLVTRATIFGIAPAIISGIVYKDDDDYEDLPDYIKNGYWLFKTGEGKFARVPQGRVMSTLSTIAKDILEVGQGKKNVTEALKNALSNTIEQSAPNNPIENNIASPLFQVKNNKSWYGSDIVGTRLQKLPEAEQYDERTDEFSKFLGEQLNISPKKINYLIDQYSGGFGDVILPALTPYAENNIIEDKFTTDAVLKNKHVGKFYDLLEEMEKQKNSKKATEDDNLMYKYLYSQNSAMSDYYKQKREIESSDELTDKEKKEQVREVQKNINNIAEQAIEEYQNLNKKSNYATIGGQEYKKNTKGEWETITEKKQEKVDGLKLSDTQKDKYYTIQNKISNINKKYSDDNKNVAAKRQEITNTIKNTNLSDNAKVQLYKSSYSTDTKIYKAIDCGISADKYLTYASKTFTADKDKNGKSISGSKKTKVISYVNSLDLSAGQKAVLLKMEGYNDYNKQAIQYINGLNISASKKQSIYKDLGFKVNNNGTISW